MKYIGYVHNGLVGCKQEFDFEIDDEDLKNMDENEIEKIAFEEMLQQIDWGYDPE